MKIDELSLDDPEVLAMTRLDKTKEKNTCPACGHTQCLECHQELIEIENHAMREERELVRGVITCCQCEKKLREGPTE